MHANEAEQGACGPPTVASLSLLQAFSNRIFSGLCPNLKGSLFYWIHVLAIIFLKRSKYVIKVKT